MIRRDDTGAEIRAVIIAIRIRGGEFRPNAVDRSGGFCCQVPPNPAWTLLRRPGLQAWVFKPLTRPEQPEHSCHSQLHNWPDNGGTMPSKSPSFTPSSILFRPRQNPGDWAWVEAPGTAPGSERFIATAVYRHIRLAPAHRI